MDHPLREVKSVYVGKWRVTWQILLIFWACGRFQPWPRFFNTALYPRPLPWDYISSWRKDSLIPWNLDLCHELFWPIACSRSDSAISESGSKKALCFPFVHVLRTLHREHLWPGLLGNERHGLRRMRQVWAQAVPIEPSSWPQTWEQWVILF